MKISKFSLVDLKVEIPAVEETKEGLLSGGFTFLGSEGNAGQTNKLCNSECNEGCNTGCNSGCNSQCNSECNSKCNIGCNVKCNVKDSLGQISMLF